MWDHLSLGYAMDKYDRYARVRPSPSIGNEKQQQQHNQQRGDEKKLNAAVLSRSLTYVNKYVPPLFYGPHAED